MREYYCISQLTGRGYEVLLDSVDSTILAVFYNGNMQCYDANVAVAGQDQIETKIAA